MILVVAFIIIVILFILSFFINYSQEERSHFYTTEVCPTFNEIHQHRGEILAELQSAKKWNPWPERGLYANDGDWKVFPFYAFGIWVEENCDKLPVLSKFIKDIPGLKLATLSKLSAGMKLKPHRGWGNHSNFVLRCHYGLRVPVGCYIEITDHKTGKVERQYHGEDEWMVFDDSEIHMAANESDEDRIILIIDIDRPEDVQLGNSTVGDTTELKNIVEYFKKLN